jgi:hypothetical protein
MKNGLTLEELAVKLETDRNRIQDYKVDTRELKVMTSQEAGTELLLPGGLGEHEVTNHAHRQLGTDLKVRADFYDRMRHTHPMLFDQMVNGLLDRWEHDHDGKPGQRMIRTYTDGGGPDGTQPIARAVLSPKFRRLDNYQVAMAVLPMVAEIPNAKVESCDVTETRMYLKVVAPLTQVDLHDLIEPGHHQFLADDGNPDHCQAGFVLTNSEVGNGQLKVEQMLFRLRCLNGLIIGKTLGKTHIGAAVTAGEDFSIYRDETLAASDKAVMMKVQDAVRSCVDEVKFTQLAAQFADAKTTQPMENPVQAMEVLGETVGLNEGEGQKALQYLLADGDLSKFGAVNSITRMAQDVQSYDRSTELEQLAASKVLAMPKTEWARVAETKGALATA